MTPAFWSGHRDFVTSHTGFKDSWLAIWLQSLGAKLSGLALPPAENSLYLPANIAEGMRSDHGDIRAPRILGRIMNDTFWIGLWPDLDHAMLDDTCDKHSQLFGGGI